MKNVIKHSKKGILMVTMFATLLSFANEVSFFTIKNDAEKTSLTLKNVKEGNLLFIKDENGMTLYKELIQKTGTYTKGFDLTSLPDGAYVFELDKDVEIKTIPFTVESSELHFNKSLEKTIYKPVTRIKGDLVYVSRLSMDKEPLKIDIYFNTDGGVPDLVYSETIENTMSTYKVFKLTKKFKGFYKIVYSTNEKEFTKRIY